MQEGFRLDIERTITKLRESGILLPMSWWEFSKKVDIHSSDFSVRWIGDQYLRSSSELI